MRLDAFDYHLPKALIAQSPLADRTASRLMVVDRETGEFEHATFRDLSRYLTSGDTLVVNRSRVIPARLFVRRPSGGRIEFLVTRVVGERQFTALANPIRRAKTGETLSGECGSGAGENASEGVGRGAGENASAEKPFACRVVARENEREVRVEITSPQTVHDVLDACGHVPLPPYIDRPDRASDRERYQTVFASEKGSVAAPTAGLHFDEPLLSALRSKGVGVCAVTLHVGPGTFLPLERETVEDNKLQGEAFSIDGKTLVEIARARVSGRRIVAVGTTASRVLETAAARGWLDQTDPHSGRLDRTHPAREATDTARAGETNLFIYPGYQFRCVNRLITNFHLPKSSLLLLVCAFLGTEKTLACYEAAVRENYRFYSYGDAMLIR
jgi:S-adenosylmethionine:tRNA ribosyltransferase-isomerase